VAAPRWVDYAVGYEIFVRSFADSDGDGVGDLRGLTGKLDYLKDELGVDLLWLMPITESPSYHGYDTTDYAHVERDYGTDADLQALLKAAHARGVRVILDLVLNHSSSQHPWFVDAASGPGAAHRGWYVWRDAEPDLAAWARPWGGGPTWHERGGAWYYALFWEGMPDLDWTNAEARAALLGVVRDWIDRGVDGYRLDAARYLVETGPGAGQADTPETHAALAAIHEAAVNAAAGGPRTGDEPRPAPLLVGEVWTDTDVVATYFGDAGAPELDMAFDFDLAAGLVRGIELGSPTPARGALCARLSRFPARGRAGTFLTNHDQVRVASELAGRGPRALKLAAGLLLTLPGTPWIYYGEEIGMRNGPGGGDEAKRLPMQWSPGGASAGFSTGTPWRAPASVAALDTVAGQRADSQSFLRTYARLIALRHAHEALATGGTRVLEARAADGGGAAPWAFTRTTSHERLLVVANFADAAGAVEVGPEGLGEGLRWGVVEDLDGGLGGTGAAVERDAATAPLVLGPLPALGLAVLRAL